MSVGRAVVESCRTRAPEVVVPRPFSPAPLLAALVPARLRDRIFRWLQPNRLLAPEVQKARSTYEGAIAKAVAR